ncbi:MAG: hypothetical protein H6819_07005 [Phycisphaerales bacterium]|nr:hypothetical protein [Phycisphaerales bacterium]MCB9855330.1 hypothetical protein [Phycisphaerales bacterium]MCB9862923.1 hypothetical protein [Phycisphaerales bacterium]
MTNDTDFQKHSMRRLHELQRRAEAIGATRDPEIQTYFSLLAHDPKSWALAHVLSSLLDDFEAEQRISPNWLAPPPQQDDLYPPTCPPEFEIGTTTETGARFGLRIALECGSTLVTGISGGGKTSLVQQSLVEIHQKLTNVAQLVFDIKGDFTGVASILHPEVRVFRIREETPLCLIKPPKGVTRESWLPRIATYLCEYRGLKKSRHLLLDVLRRLCVHFGVDTDPTRPWPSLHNVLDFLKGVRCLRYGKDAEYRASLINELQGLLNDSGVVFDTCDGVEVLDHLLAPGGITVLQMETLPAPAQQFIIALVVERIVASRVARNVHNVALEVLVVLDEAQLVLSRKADFEAENGVAPLAMQLLRGRESGVGFIVVPHLLPDTSRAVLASAKTMIVVGGLTDVMSIDIAANMMNLPPKAKTMIPRLGRGQGLVREVGLCDYTDAFLVDFDKPKLSKGAIDEATRRRLMLTKLAALRTQPSRPLTDYPTIMAELNIPWNSPKPASTAKNTTSQSLSQEEIDLLQDCARHRDDWMKERRSRLNVRDYKRMQKNAQSLEAAGLVRVHDIRLGRANYTFIEVMDAGWKMLGWARPPHYLGHGGLVHTVLIARVARHLASKKWTNVQTEFQVGPCRHAVDVYGRSPKAVPTAFEITLSKSNVVSNALKTLSNNGGIRELIFLCPVQADCTKVETMIRNEPLLTPLRPQIRFRRIDAFI